MITKVPFSWPNFKISSEWSLFLDRDGVINERLPEDYIKEWDEFRFLPGVLDALSILSLHFRRIFIVTNQRGVTKELMTIDDLLEIHEKMKKEIEDAGGKIDGIYFCTAMDPKDPDRKPNPGMAYQVLIDFPEIDLSKSIMVGNKPSDMRFGKNAGMYTVYMATTHPETPFPHPDIDNRYNSLIEFAKVL